MAEYITEEGMKKLRRRMSHLLEDERPEVIRQVQTAREMGDLSENAEYHAARERQRHIDNELEHLRRRLSVLQVINPDDIPKDAVRFGAYVDVEESETGKQVQYRLVGVDEVEDTGSDLVLISVASPIGRAMVGKKIGEDFIVKAPVGDRKMKILDIK